MAQSQDFMLGWQREAMFIANVSFSVDCNMQRVCIEEVKSLFTEPVGFSDTNITYIHHSKFFQESRSSG
jgi:hypothetical protein